eukprot:109132_1
MAQHDEHDEHDEHEDIDDHDEHDDHDTDHNDETTIWTAFAITCFAGCAAFLGGFSIFCVKIDQIGVMSCALSFSAGVTIHLSLVSLIPECIELLSHWSDRSAALTHLYALLCVFVGILIGLSMEVLFKYFGVDPHHHSGPDSSDRTSTTTPNSRDMVTITDVEETHLIATASEAPSRHVTNIESPQDSAEARPLKSYGKVRSLPSQSDIQLEALPMPCTGCTEDTNEETNENELNLSQTSYAVAFALILHHFPEGIATFVSLYHDLEFGILVAFALALHDIPSGICISVPLYCATGSKAKPFLLCAVAAIVYPIGACIGWVIIKTNSSAKFIDTFIAILVGITGGIMLYISLVELLPTAIISANNASHLKENDKAKHVLTKSLCWLFAGLLVMSVSNILLLQAGGHSH